MISRRILLTGAAGSLAAQAVVKTVRAAPENESSVLTLPDRTMRVFYMVRGRHVASIESRDAGRTWSEARIEFAVQGPNAHACVAILDRRQEIHVFFLVMRGEGRRLAIERFVDVWHARSTRARSEWLPPRRIFEGYVGSLRSVIQTGTGIIVLPFAVWQPDRQPAPPFGANEVTALCSSDDGQTWKLSRSRLRSPCLEDYNGSNYGAVEPCIVERRDGFLWMLMRTQTGCLYESFSEDGLDWSEAGPTRFTSSNSPAALLRLRSGPLVLLWNNCVPPPRFQGQGVYGGRDALHAAISGDDGQTWRGFREVYLDPARNESPPRVGDRATAYPHAAEAPDGHIVVATGQGERSRALLRFDPDWLLDRQRTAILTHGLDDWSTYESFGPASGYWRDRRQTAVLTTLQGRPALRIGSGAVWNFPSGAKGTLKIDLVLQPVAGDARLSLTDCFYDPSDQSGDAGAVFTVRLEDLGVKPGQTARLRIEWDPNACRIESGDLQMTIFERRPAPNGISYLRLQSPGAGDYSSALFVTKVSADVR